MSATNYSGSRRLGDFEVIRELGRGGMGVVYEARQISLNRKVALKVLSSGLGLTPKAVQRFHREAEAAAKLHHTNIVPVFGVGLDEIFCELQWLRGPRAELVQSANGSSRPTESRRARDAGRIAHALWRGRLRDEPDSSSAAPSNLDSGHWKRARFSRILSPCSRRPAMPAEKLGGRRRFCSRPA